MWGRQLKVSQIYQSTFCLRQINSTWLIVWHTLSSYFFFFFLVCVYDTIACKCCLQYTSEIKVQNTIRTEHKDLALCPINWRSVPNVMHKNERVHNKKQILFSWEETNLPSCSCVSIKAFVLQNLWWLTTGMQTNETLPRHCLTQWTAPGVTIFQQVNRSSLLQRKTKVGRTRQCSLMRASNTELYYY